jgi:hypothetical protein
MLSGPYTYQSVFSPFELTRVVYGTREGQKIEAVPLDERLRLRPGAHSFEAMPCPYLKASNEPTGSRARTG